MQPFFVEPVSRRQFLARMLSNLKMIYLDKQDLAKALLAVERIVLLLPDSLTELRDRGLLYYQLVRWLEAARNLETYLEKAPSTEDAGVIRQLLRELRKNDFNP
jgi:regulator of sirC expression with transglutaminase-like and TPR domain